MSLLRADPTGQNQPTQGGSGQEYLAKLGMWRADRVSVASIFSSSRIHVFSNDSTRIMIGRGGMEWNELDSY